MNILAYFIFYYFYIEVYAIKYTNRGVQLNLDMCIYLCNHHPDQDCQMSSLIFSPLTYVIHFPTPVMW